MPGKPKKKVNKFDELLGVADMPMPMMQTEKPKNKPKAKPKSKKK